LNGYINVAVIFLLYQSFIVAYRTRSHYNFDATMSTLFCHPCTIKEIDPENGNLVDVPTFLFDELGDDDDQRLTRDRVLLAWTL